VCRVRSQTVEGGPDVIVARVAMDGGEVTLRFPLDALMPGLPSRATLSWALALLSTHSERSGSSLSLPFGR
jgi:hypothetical protein